MNKYVLVAIAALLTSGSVSALISPQLELVNMNSSKDYDSNYYFERVTTNSPATISDTPSPIDEASINEIRLHPDQTSQPLYLILSHPLSNPSDNAVLIRVVSNGSNALFGISIKSNGEYQMQPEYGSGGIAFSWKSRGDSLEIDFCTPSSFSNKACHRS